MGKVSSLHQADSLTMPLADGARVSVTPFRESPRVAIAFYGPGGGDSGGALLSAGRTRLLASWLLRLADECGAPAGPRRRASGAGAPSALAPAPSCDAALLGIARLAVSVLADRCAIDVHEPDGSLRRLVAHADRAKAAPGRKREKHVPSDSPARHAGRARIARTVRGPSSLTVPLPGRVRTLGVMTLVFAEARRRHTETDLCLARELGRLAGLVLETARRGATPPADLSGRRDRGRRASTCGPLAR